MPRKPAEWHAKARKMRAAGMTLQAIADAFGVTKQAVHYATDASVRQRIIAAAARWNAESRSSARARALAVAREYGCGDAI